MSNNFHHLDSPAGAPMPPKGMEPVICRACWAAGGIFRPVPVDGKKSCFAQDWFETLNTLIRGLLLLFKLYSGTWSIQKDYNKPSASRAISCRRPVVPRSMPVLSSSSLSRNELAVEESERSVTCPTFIGRPASSKPFSCSNAFFAHSASANFRRWRG